MKNESRPTLLILNQWAGPITWELTEYLGEKCGPVALFTGHPDTLGKQGTDKVKLFSAPKYRRDSYLRRILSWIWYVIQAFFWVRKFPKTTPLLIYSNPPILPWLGWLLNKFRGQKYGLIIHDLYPNVLVNLRGISDSHLIVRLWRFLNRCAFARASMISTLGEQMAFHISEQMSRSSELQIHVVPPWVDANFIRPMPKEDNWFAKKYDQLNHLTVMYSGNMGLGHDIETMLEAAKQLREFPQIHFMFIGDGPKWQFVAQWLEDADVSNVTLLPWQPLETLPFSLSAADVALISIEPGIEGLMIPSKAIYALAAGSVPIVLTHDSSELVDWIQQYNCGVVLPPGDVDGLVAIIRRLSQDRNELQNYRQYARAAAEARFDKRMNVQQLTDLIVQSVLDS